MFRSPLNDDRTTIPAGAETATFVGRPFSLDEAPQHRAGLRRWVSCSVRRFLLFMATHTLNSALLYKVHFFITWSGAPGGFDISAFLSWVPSRSFAPVWVSCHVDVTKQLSSEVTPTKNCLRECSPPRPFSTPLATDARPFDANQQWSEAVITTDTRHPWYRPTPLSSASKPIFFRSSVLDLRLPSEIVIIASTSAYIFVHSNIAT